MKQNKCTEYGMHLKRGWTSHAVRLVGQKREDRTAEQKRVARKRFSKFEKGNNNLICKENKENRTLETT